MRPGWHRQHSAGRDRATGTLSWGQDTLSPVIQPEMSPARFVPVTAMIWLEKPSQEKVPLVQSSLLSRPLADPTATHW